MIGRLNFFKVMLMLGLTMMIGCSSLVPGKKSYVVFIDYTESALTFVGDNPARIKRLLSVLAEEMEPEDLLQVYPIHAYTESASSLLLLNGPQLQGDLRDKHRREHWKENVVAPSLENVLAERFNNDRTSRTNIYPIIRKILRLKMEGYKVEAYLASDMIQHFDDQDFSTMFGKGSDIDPIELSRTKVSELGVEDVLDGIAALVMIPGTPHGSQDYDRIRVKVNVFWEEFFSRCGADVVIQDL